MAVQQRRDFTNYPLVIFGEPIYKDNETIAQDAGRVTVLKTGTIMCQVAATKKWKPLTDVTAVATGENTARGVYAGPDIAAADIAAGDVKAPILVCGIGCTLDAQLVVLENNLTLDTVVTDDPAGADNGVVNARRIEDDLIRIGVLVEGTKDVMNLEN